MELHPAFATSYDWHSSVHMHWLAARLLAHGLPTEQQAALTAVLQDHLRADHLATEAAYLRAAPHFERPYGWAWLLRLAAEVTVSEVPEVRALAPGFVPVVDTIADLVTDWTASAAHPVRHGVHSNSAFGLLLVHDAARVLDRPELVATVGRTARTWFGGDAGWPFAWERSGHDFLSAGLAEADLMAAVLSPEEYRAWAPDFLATVDAGAQVLRPTVVCDPSDAQQVHLYGLDLSRAGSAVRIVAALRTDGDDVPVAGLLDAAVDELLSSGLEAAVGEEYYSTHWLASFAWDAMEAREGAAR
ncbi:hypothetical protein Cus16_2543 [Curtobacterium sp. ER1/6]|nr:hypothetical protein Cus16_2543 [Curtobacterium sp. ER1/6]